MYKYKEKREYRVFKDGVDIGVWKEGKPGEFKLTLSAKKSKSNKKIVQGRMINMDGSYYEGQLKNNKRHGFGSEYAAEGDWQTSCGYWKNDLRDGQQLQIWNDGQKISKYFLCTYKKGQMVGQGMQYYSGKAGDTERDNDSCYIGQFRDGLREEFGLQSY